MRFFGHAKLVLVGTDASVTLGAEHLFGDKFTIHRVTSRASERKIKFILASAAGRRVGEFSAKLRCVSDDRLTSGASSSLGDRSAAQLSCAER